MTAIGLSIVQTSLCVYGLVYLFTALGTPRWFLDHLSIEEAEHRYRTRNRCGPGQSWRVYLAAGLTCASLITLLWSASYGVVAAIPFDWQRYDEDGEVGSTRDAIRASIAFFGGLALTSLLERAARGRGSGA